MIIGSTSNALYEQDIDSDNFNGKSQNTLRIEMHFGLVGDLRSCPSLSVGRHGTSHLTL
jgi:hypothetical protein